jgi:2-polyprenyl-6-methoxyphenol hydroxylase-like FAD-dependent oxidoreductase
VPAVCRVLVIGAGTAGAATAIFLAREGIAVDLIDVEDEVTALGSGISLQGNALRVLRQLGALDEVLGAGYPFDTLGLRVPDERTSLAAEIPAVKMGGPDLPSTLGMLRPDLARILVEQAGRAGAAIRFARSVSELAPDPDGVDVTFADGTGGRYDLVVGADGIRSATRRMLGIEAEPPRTWLSPPPTPRG